MWLLTVAVLGAQVTDTRVVTLQYQHESLEDCTRQGTDAMAEILATGKQARFWCRSVVR